MKGMRCDIYRSLEMGDCSNGGISSRCDEVTLVGENVPQIFEADDDYAPAVEIVWSWWQGEAFCFARPVGLDNAMFGGTFIYSSDSRFRFDYPIKLYDRVEKAE